MWRHALLTTALTLAACGRCGSSKPVSVVDMAWLDGSPVPDAAGVSPRRGGSLTIRVAVEPSGFTRVHDRYAEGTMVRYTTGTIYETLARVDTLNPEGPLLPWLASSFSVGAQLTIFLRPQVLFHDGSAFTSADVKAVLESIVDEKNPTVSMRAALGALESVETPDEQTVIVRWKSAPTPFAVRALLGAVPMMPARALKGDFDTLAIHRAPIGTGPFRLSSFSPGERLVLERFVPHRDGAFLDSIIVRFVKDDFIAFQLWERGEFDLMTRISPASWRAVESQAWAFAGYQRLRVDENAYGWIGWNQQRAVLSDVRVRRALAMLYPAEVISKSIEFGLESRTTCPFLLGSKSCDPAVSPIAFDPEGAMAVLHAAGWEDSDGDGVREKDGQRLSFSFLLVTSSDRLTKMVGLFQEQLRRAGVEMTIEPVDAAQSIQRMRTHDFDAAAMIWSIADAVSDQYDLFHSSQASGGKNYVNLSDKDIDAILDAIRVAPDDDVRNALERRLHRLLFDRQVYLFLTARPALDAAKRHVHGLRPSIAGYDFSRVWVDR
jgi:peptide/nickel transport system substrate-binding protein